MTSLENRIDLCRQWFVKTQGTVEDADGWGWVSDVPPNPQNTAEVVCALGDAGLAVPNHLRVERLMRTQAVSSPRGEWVFREPIDLAWRLRALQHLGAAPEDPDVQAGIDALIATQLPAGGWRMGSTSGPVSITATSGAILALLETGHEGALDCALNGTLLLAQHSNGGDHAPGQVYAAAHTTYVLSRPQVTYLAGRQVRRAHDVACDRLLDYLSSRTYPGEEEPFSRNGVIETWRHLTLPLALRALVAARPELLFEPAFRDGLVALLALQDTVATHATYGAFRTSPEGFVTSYATTQGLEVMATVRRDLDTRVNPAVAFDLICHRRSAHHSDPQTLFTVGTMSVIMNSTAGLAIMSLSVVAGVALTAAAAALEGTVTGTLSRVFLVLGSLITGLGISAYLSARLHRTAGRKIVLVSFTLFTALVLPVLTFVLY